MVNGLQALEFTDCLLDSPEFRENLNRHEKELERTSSQIKRIIKEVKDLLSAAKSKSFITVIIYVCLEFVSSTSLYERFQFSLEPYLHKPSNCRHRMRVCAT